jgi:hypothetical protein
LLELILNRYHPFSVEMRTLRLRLRWLLWMIGIVGFTGLVGMVMISIGPQPVMIAWIIYLLGVLAILIRPRYGLYLILCFGLIGDNNLLSWFPFIKNFSSGESLLYLHPTVIFSPMETYVVLVLFSWLIRGVVRRKLDFYRGPLFWPAVVFMFFVALGMIYGVSTGGNFNIALWEARPLFYLFVLLILTSNLLETRQHIRWLMWAAMIGLFIEGVNGAYIYLVVLNGNLAGSEAIAEHTASSHMNTVFVLAMTIWMYKSPPGMRLGMLIIVPFVLLTYLANQRRASFVGLAAAIVLIFLVLYLDNRKAFWIIFPPLAVIAMLYMGAFWNSTGALGLPARSVKSALFPNQITARDQASNVYRIIENINTGFTIHQKPLTGVGFGQKFYIIIPLPDISFFEWWEYFPHNSIIWIWLKTGVGGFIAMLYLLGTAIMTGVDVFRRMPKTEMRAFALTATLFIVMHSVFAYVDISWDSQSMVYLGLLMGLINRIEPVVLKKEPIPAKRWPWLEEIEEAAA